jgi:hypothetical protein
VRNEIFQGSEVKGAHRSGTEWAAATILGYACAAYALYFTSPNIVTGERALLNCEHMNTCTDFYGES